MGQGSERRKSTDDSPNRRRRGSPAVTGSSLVDQGARVTLDRAAEAVGLSTDQLVNLVADSGLMAQPPSDGLTEVLTLEDLGKRLYQLCATTPKTKRSEWFRGLVPTQQQALLTVLRNRGFSTTTIAQDFNLDPMAVVEAYNKYADNIGKNVVNTRLSTIAGHMQIAAERAQQGAMEKDDWAAFWRIQKEMVALLQSMGIVDRAAQKIEVDQKVTIGEGEKEAEVDAIMALLSQKHQRKIEIEKSEKEKFSELPDMGDEEQ